MLHVALRIHLRLIEFGRRWQRNDPEHTRADPLGNRLDRTALASAIAPLEDDADLESLGNDPFLQFHQFDVQFCQFTLIVFRPSFVPAAAACFAAFFLSPSSLPLIQTEFLYFT